MSISGGGGESYPGRSFSISQLLYAAKKKLEGPTFPRSIGLSMSQANVEVLERDVLEVLSLVRSVKNTFIPINRIPCEVLSTIPDHWAGERTADEDLITLTHVSHGWREIFTSRPSLWARLDCANVKKTRVYIERSKSSPLKVYLWDGGHHRPFLNDAFLLTVPHLGRLGSLSLSGSSDNLAEIINEHFNFSAPLLEKLSITFPVNPRSINAAILDGNLSSLRELRLSGVVTSLPWKNMANLTTFDFRQIPSNKISITQLLDFFECAPLLSYITLWNTIPATFNASPDRVVSLPSLEKFDIIAQPVHSILLKHLLIPYGASLTLGFNFNGDKSPIPHYLPKTLKGFNNLGHATSINLCCNSQMSLRLSGPSGELYVIGTWTGVVTSLPAIHRRFLRSLDHFNVSAMERFMITAYNTPSPPETKNPSPHQILLPMIILRTLTLIDCLNISFISALNPSRTPTRILVCPKLEELVLHIKKKELFCINELLEMARERNSRGAGLSTITIFSPQEFVPTKEVLRLRDHVSRVEYRLDDTVPEWDEVPGDVEHLCYE